MTQQGRKTQLSYQWLRELVERVRKNHYLKPLAQPVDELHGALQRLESTDHFLNIRQFQTVFIKNPQALLHQHVVIGNVPRGGTQRFDAGFLGKGDPDFRDQNTLQVQADNFHSTLLKPFTLDASATLAAGNGH
ncbi:Unknown protein sequence [Pseudomonas syringae pv. aceris]|nr:Unknown protein sequence [Pseudomonas syringae pv. aceris]